jgi:hypothetical protein
MTLNSPASVSVRSIVELQSQYWISSLAVTVCLVVELIAPKYSRISFMYDLLIYSFVGAIFWKFSLSFLSSVVEASMENDINVKRVIE